MKKISFGLAAALLATTAFAHGDHDPSQGHQKPPPFAIVQLDAVRDATAQFIDVAAAEAAGYHDIGLFVPHMGWHYMKDALVDCAQNAKREELLNTVMTTKANSIMRPSKSGGLYSLFLPRWAECRLDKTEADDIFFQNSLDF